MDILSKELIVYGISNISQEQASIVGGHHNASIESWNSHGFAFEDAF